MKPKLTYAFIVLWTILSSLVSGISSAQVTSAFTASPKTGCTPLYVSFNNTSTGSGTLTYSWDFGNGNTSNLQNPSQTYNTCGNYVVTLTVSNGSKTATDTAHITVYCKPIVNFTYDNSSGCPGTCVLFTNTSVAGSGTISSVFWDFGDGNTSTSATPMHCYMSPGIYNVTLTVTNSFGCSNSTVISNAITINKPPVANFSGTPTFQCQAPATVNFSNFSSGSGNLMYKWDFGDPGSGSSNASTASTPAHTYNASGSYTVMLIVTDGNGCKDTLILTNYINIGSLSATITTSPSSQGCCPFIVKFGETSSSTPIAYQWTFGGGIANSTQQNPQITFPCPAGNTPDIYNVTLTETFAGGCTTTATTTITVSNKPQADFTSGSNLNTCLLPNLVVFNNISTGTAGMKYEWFFGDGDTSNKVNPSHAYKACGAYNVMLVATNKYGCTDTMKKAAFVNITCPVATFTATPGDGCLPKTVSFNSTASTENPIKWRWNFGDPASGTADTSSLQNPFHIYSQAGCYNVTLITTNALGCTDSTQVSNAVCVDNPATTNFSATPTTACAYLSIAFTNLSKGTDTLSTYFWKFGDGGTSTSQNPSHIYGDTGYFSVTLIVCNAGCCDTLTLNNYIHILPPIAKVNVTIDCQDPYNICFDGSKSIGATTYDWNFGDPGSGTLDSSTSIKPCHRYSSSGNYSVSLTVTNSTTGCSFTQTTTVHARDVKAAFTYSPQNGCVPLNVVAVNNSSDGNSYQWIVTDSATKVVVFTSTQTAPTFSFTNSGVYIFELIATDVNGCSDTLISPAHLDAYGITPNFIVTPTSGCSPLDAQFTDASTSTGGPVTSWSWNFGDPFHSSTQDTSSKQDPQHIYTKPGTYTITLIAVDSLGCTLSKTHTVSVKTPGTTLKAADTSGCIGSQICFTSSPNGNNYTYHWNFGDPSSGTNDSSSLPNPCHIYNAIGKYSVSLTIIGPTGCDSTLVKPNYITISSPVANFGVNGQTFSICPPLLVNFIDSSHSNITSWLWNFGDGNTSTIQNPSHVYSIPGSYTVTLIVTSASGCTDTLVRTDYINVKGPNGTFIFTPNRGCAPLDVCFKANASANLTFIWNYGNTTSGPLPGGDSICYYYNVPGVYHPSLILQDSAGCIFSINSPDSVSVLGAYAKFGMSDNPLCGPGTISFSDSTYSIAKIASWQWNFGDAASGASDSSHLQNPSHNYADTGKYAVTLLVTTVDGCTSTYQDTLNVYPKPIALIHVLNNPVCPNGIISFRDSSSSVHKLISWAWNFGDPGSGGFNTSGLQNVSHKYKKPGTYTVSLIIVDTMGCRDTTTTKVLVNPLPNANAGPSAKICVGTSTTLDASGGIDYLWTPATSLSNDSINDPSASPTISTTYTVLVTDVNGCQNTDSLVVTVHTLPVDSISPTQKVCIGSSTTLFAKGGIKYNWSPNIGLSSSTISDPVAHPTVTTTYTVLVTDANGCKNQDSVEVKINPLPPANAGPNNNICIGASVKLNGSGGVTYTWYSEPSGFTSTSASPLVTPTVTTEYIVDVTDTNHCNASDSTIVFVHQLPDANVSANSVLCLGSSTQLFASGGTKYDWYPPTGLSDTTSYDPTANPKDTTKYFVTVTNIFGCKAKDSVTLDVVFPFVAKINAGDTICAGSTVQLNATGGAEYSWSPSSSLNSATISDPLASPTISTVYTVIVSDGICFNDTETVNIHVYPNPKFYAGADQTIMAGQQVLLGQQTPTFEGTFTWTPTYDLSCDHCQNPTARPDSTTTYIVSLLNEYGCITSDTVKLTVICPDDVLYIPNAFTPNNDGVDDVFYLRSKGLRQLNYFRVFDRWGQLLFETNNEDVGWDGTFKGVKLPPAVYVYELNAVCSTGATVEKKGNVTLIR